MMTLEEIMQTEWWQRSPEEQKSYERQLDDTNKEIFDRIINPLGKLSGGLKIVRGAKGAKTRRLLGEPGSEEKKSLPSLEDFTQVTPKEFHKMMDSIRGLTVEKKSLPSLEEIVKKGGSLWKGTGKKQGAMFGVESGPTENELIALHVDEKNRGRGLGTAAQNAAKVVNRGMPGDKPLVGYGYLQVPEEGSDLRRFGTTGGRGQLQSVIKWNPEYADPEFLKRGYAPTDIGRFKRSGIDPEIPMPFDIEKDYEKYTGKLSDIQTVGQGQIPGGLEGKFTHSDLFWLRANPLDLKLLSPEQIDLLYAKQARTMTRDLDDPYERQNTLAFGQLSGNSDLDTSELALSRLRMTDPETVNRLASYIPQGRKWSDLTTNTYKKGPDGKHLMEPNPNKPGKMRRVLDVQGERSEISNRIISDYNLEERGRGGLGIASSLDFSAVAELARLFKENPDFHKQLPGQSDKEYIEVLMNQIPGISQKTGSLAKLLQSPMTSSLGALDRHIVRNLDLKPSGIATTAGYTPTPTYPTHRDSPRVSQHIKGLDVSQLKSPKGDVQWMSPEYNRGLDLLAKSAKGKPFGPGMEQWRRWDADERGFFSPHEALYPGVHKLPRMPDHRVESGRKTLADAGYWSKTDPDNPYRFQPKKIENWKDAIVWGVTPLEKILNTFKPRPPQAQALRGGGLNMMRYGSGS